MLIMAWNVWKTVAGKQAVDAPIPQRCAAAAAGAYLSVQRESCSMKLSHDVIERTRACWSR